MLCKYEESALSEYCNHSEGHFIIKGSEVEKDLEELPKTLKNPFKEVYFWLKGECYDCFVRYRRTIGNFGDDKKQRKAD